MTKVIAIVSGKGGTGKTTLSTNLSTALSEKKNVGFRKKEYKIGLFDVDIETSNVPIHMGIKDKMQLDEKGKLRPINVKENLKVMSMATWSETAGVALDENGKKQWLKDSLLDSDWGKLDFLIIDTASASANEIITIKELFNKIDGVIVVLNDDKSTLHDGEGIIEICIHNKIPILGMVGNLVGSETNHGVKSICSCGCEKEFSPFGSEKQIKELCIKYGIDYLGSIPLSEKIRGYIQQGKPSLSHNNGVIAEIMKKVI